MVFFNKNKFLSCLMILSILLNACGSREKKTYVHPEKPSTLKLGQAKLIIPQGAVDQKARIIGKIISKPSRTMAESGTIRSKIFHFSGYEGKRFNKKVILEIPFRKDRTTNSKKELTPAYWDNDQWIDVNGKLNGSKFIIETNHLSYWAVIETKDINTFSNTIDNLINRYRENPKNNQRYVLPVAKFRINSDGMDGVIFGSSILGFFSHVTQFTNIKSLVQDLLIQESVPFTTKLIHKKNYPLRYLTICNPLDTEKKTSLNIDDFIFIAEQSNDLPLGRPVEITIDSKHKKFSIPKCFTINDYKVIYPELKGYKYFTVGEAGHRMSPGRPWIKKIQTIGMVNGYIEYEGKLMGIMRHYQPLKLGIDLDTYMYFVAFDVSEMESFPEIGSVVYAYGETRRVEGWPIKQYDLPKMRYQKTKCAEYLSLKGIKLIKGQFV